MSFGLRVCARCSTFCHERGSFIVPGSHADTAYRDLLDSRISDDGPLHTQRHGGWCGITVNVDLCFGTHAASYFKQRLRVAPGLTHSVRRFTRQQLLPLRDVSVCYRTLTLSGSEINANTSAGGMEHDA